MTKCESEIEVQRCPPPTDAELEAAVLGAQAGESWAMELFYKWFRPLILKQVAREDVYQILGEDAENLCWVIFYETIISYKGDKYSSLPGYLKCALESKLINILTRRRNSDYLIFLDEEAVMNSVGTEDSWWDEQVDNLCLVQAIEALRPVQRCIIKMLYWDEKTMKDIAAILKMEVRRVRYLHFLALKKIKKLYSADRERR